MHALLWIGIVLIVAGNLWFAALAFRTSLLWGLFVLVVPGASLLFLVKRWKECRWAWWLSLAGLLLCLVQKALES